MLYLLESKGYLKIGYTCNLDERLKSYNTHNPNYRLLDTTSGSIKEETFLHLICKRWQHDNEWYYFNKELLFVWLDFVKQKEPKMCAYDYSSFGGRENSLMYNLAVNWEEEFTKESFYDKYTKHQTEQLTKRDLIKQVIADSKQYLR